MNRVLDAALGALTVVVTTLLFMSMVGITVLAAGTTVRPTFLCLPVK